MKEILHFPRLGMLFRKHWIEHYRLYGMAVLALVGILVLVFSIWVFGDGGRAIYREDQAGVFYIVGLFGVGTIFASLAFSDLADKSKGIAYLSIPASTLEKLITAAFFHIIFFAVLYTGVFLLVAKLFFVYLNSLHRLENGVELFRVIPMDWKDDEIQDVSRLIPIIFLGVQSFFILGSVFLGRFAFIKTIVLGGAVVILFVFCMSWLDRSLADNLKVPHVSWSLLDIKVYGSYQVIEAGDATSVKDAIPNNQIRVVSLPDWLKDLFTVLFKYMWAPVFLTIAFFRLKEKEI